MMVMVQSQPKITWKLLGILRDRIIQDIFYTNLNTKRVLQLQRTLEDALSLISSKKFRAGHQMQLLRGYTGLVTILSWSLLIRD